jgi:6,7-dimethyl-8-ribityllumazine synthase
VGLDHQLPIANAILTTENMEQAIARQVDKGRDAAQVVVEMVQHLRNWPGAGRGSRAGDAA